MNAHAGPPPLEYRLALDAAFSRIAPAAVSIRCDTRPLASEAEQRLAAISKNDSLGGVIWLEPQRSNWQDATKVLFSEVPAGALVVIISQPLAKRLPGRIAWGDDPLGWQTGGMRRLRSLLAQEGFQLHFQMGFHSPFSVLLNATSRMMERLARPDLADRLLHAGRDRYLVPGWVSGICTVALLAFQKVQAA